MGDTGTSKTNMSKFASDPAAQELQSLLTKIESHQDISDVLIKEKITSTLIDPDIKTAFLQEYQTNGAIDVSATTNSRLASKIQSIDDEIETTTKNQESIISNLTRVCDRLKTLQNQNMDQSASDFQRNLKIKQLTEAQQVFGDVLKHFNEGEGFYADLKSLLNKHLLGIKDYIMSRELQAKDLIENSNIKLECVDIDEICNKIKGL